MREMWKKNHITEKRGSESAREGLFSPPDEILLKTYAMRTNCSEYSQYVDSYIAVARAHTFGAILFEFRNR